MARRPIAINVPDCSKVSAICFGLQAKTDEERKRLQGPGLLVFDANMIKAEDAVAESLYLATSVSGGVEIVDGANLVSSKRHGIASLLFLCRFVRKTYAICKLNYRYYQAFLRKFA